MLSVQRRKAKLDGDNPRANPPRRRARQGAAGQGLRSPHLSTVLSPRKGMMTDSERWRGMAAPHGALVRLPLFLKHSPACTRNSNRKRERECLPSTPLHGAKMEPWQHTCSEALLAVSRMPVMGSGGIFLGPTAPL